MRARQLASRAMRRRLSAAIVVTAGLVGWLAVSHSTRTLADIPNTMHDFELAKWWTSGDRCEVCHEQLEPADLVCDEGAPDASGLVWNHEETTATFKEYTSETLNATVGQPAAAYSRRCLDCHDGTVAVDSYGGSSGDNFIWPSGLIGTDLRQHHPISFTYDTALAAEDPLLHDPVTITTEIGGTIAEDLLFGPNNDQMECHSCHDVHNCFGTPNFFRIPMYQSALCKTCHPSD